MGLLAIDAVGFAWDPSYIIGENLVVSGTPQVPSMAIDAGEPGVTLTWMPTDLNMGVTHYDLYQNGILNATATWTPGDRVSLNVSTARTTGRTIIASLAATRPVTLAGETGFLTIEDSPSFLSSLLFQTINFLVISAINRGA